MADASSTSPSKETVTLRLPSGEMVDAIVPAGFSDADLKSYVRMKQPGLFGPPAGVQKPQVDMQTGTAPIATSFATQLSNLPKNLWEGSFFGELGNPRVKAAHEARIKAMEAPGMEGVKNTFQAANPIVTNQEGVDWGATAANLLPYAASAKGLRTPDISTSDALAAVKAVGKVAAKDAAAHVPLAGRLVQRPSIMDYVKAVQTKATPETPAVYPGAPYPTATPEQLNPTLISPSRTLPGMNPPEVTGRPTPGPIQGPSRGLMLPGETEHIIPPSKVSSTPPANLSKPDVLARLRSNAQQIQAQVPSAPAVEGRPLRIAGQDVPANADLTPGLQVPQSRVEGKIMQVLRKEGTGMSIGRDRLMDAPQLRGISPDLVQKAVINLNKQGKIWHEQTGGGAHPVSYTVALKKR